MKEFILEGCVDSVESGVRAVEGGANRLELCANLLIGGTTPSVSLFAALRDRVKVPIRVIIRPRYGDFCYNQAELEEMAGEIGRFRELGADGVVLGVLTPEGELDTAALERLLACADGLPATLHRAFDLCRDPLRALEEAAGLGFGAILTSGQRASCLEGKELLRELVARSGGRVDIMAGSGVNAAAIRILRPYTKGTSYHMSGRVEVDSPMRYRKEGVPMGLPSLGEYSRWSCDPALFREAAMALEELD